MAVFSIRIGITTTRQAFGVRSSAYLFRMFASKSSQHTSASKRNIGTIKLALFGATMGAVSGSTYSIYNNWKDKSAHIEHVRMPPIVIDSFPNDIKITKRYVNANDNSGLEIVLFQFQTCPFCCKVRAFLDYFGISYSVVEVDAVLRQDIKWSKVTTVPMVLIKKNDGRWLQMTESSAIISLISSYLIDKELDVCELAQFYPQISFFDDFGRKKHDVMNKYFLMYQDKVSKGYSKELQETERKWRTWADNHLVHLISPNCYQTMEEALESFEWFAKAGEWDIHFPQWERYLMVYLGAGAMFIVGKMLKKRHRLTDDVRSHIYNALDTWINELKKRQNEFMGGKNPNLADLAVFGVLSSMEGCQTFRDCLNNTNIGKWFYNVKDIVQKNRGKLVHERIYDANYIGINIV